jgi:hypothetical protein
MENKKETIKFKTFAMLFFQDSLQTVNAELAHLKNMQKFYMKNMRKLLHLKEEKVIEMFKDMPEMQAAYQDYLKLASGELTLEQLEASHE